MPVDTNGWGSDETCPLRVRLGRDLNDPDGVGVESGIRQRAP